MVGLCKKPLRIIKLKLLGIKRIINKYFKIVKVLFKQNNERIAEKLTIFCENKRCSLDLLDYRDEYLRGNDVSSDLIE